MNKLGPLLKRALKDSPTVAARIQSRPIVYTMWANLRAAALVHYSRNRAAKPAR
jgi:hypothetical protein